MGTHPIFESDFDCLTDFEMSDILCGWLNTRIQLKTFVNRENLGEIFWNGYNFGQILERYLLQPDFEMFSPKNTREASMRNFAMLRDSLEKLKIELSPWTINEIRHKNVTRIRTLLYQMYIALQNHQKEREAPFKGPVVYSTIESISRPTTKTSEK